MAALLISTVNWVAIAIFRPVNAWTERHPRTLAFLERTGAHQQQMEAAVRIQTEAPIILRTHPLRMAVCRCSALRTKSVALPGKSVSITNASTAAVLIQPFVILRPKFVTQTPVAASRCLALEIKTVAHHQRFARARNAYPAVTSPAGFCAQV